ncbi:hypothetical protein PENTCL1PPCAC_5029, partial [Pristionchus entomophagus]
LTPSRMTMTGASWWCVLIAGCVVQLTVALPDLNEATKLSLDELIGAGTFAPTTAAPDDTTKDWGIPPNPEAFRPVPGIKLPVFDPNLKWEGPLPPNENRDRFIPMPEGSFHVEFDKDQPVQAYNLSEPIHVDLSKYISAKFECGFCLKIVDALKKEIQKKGAQAFTDDLQKTCQSQKDTTPAQAQTNCDLIEKVKVERLASESVESLCLSEKRCKDQEEITQGNQHMEELAKENKEEDEMREKWKKQNEQQRLIIEAQEEKWRREFKRTHNDTMEPFKPFLVNLPEGFDEGSGDDNWKPDFGGWNLENDTTVEASTEASASDTATTLEPSVAGGDAETAVEEAAEKKTMVASESTPGAKFKPIEETKPTVDFLHEVLETTVQKDESASTTAATSSAAPKSDAESEVEEQPASMMMAGPAMTALLPGGESTTTATTTAATSVDGVTPTVDEAGPEPTTLFATTEAPEHFTKSALEQAGEQEARRTLQEAILEAKKTVDEDVGFMSKPAVAPNRDGAQWANGPRVNLHEFVSPHHLGTASSPKATVDATNVKEASASAEPTISPPVRAPVQCDPPGSQKPQFSAHPTTGESADAAAAAATAAEPEATKLEVAEDQQEGPANMAIPRSRPMRIVNRVVQTQFSVDDIA